MSNVRFGGPHPAVEFGGAFRLPNSFLIDLSKLFVKGKGCRGLCRFGGCNAISVSIHGSFLESTLDLRLQKGSLFRNSHGC